MIATTLGALVTAEPALERLATERLSVKAAYHVAKLARLVRLETALFHEARQKALLEFGEERDAATPEERARLGPRVITVTPEHAAAFTARLADLTALPVELAWTPLDLEALGDLRITPADLLALGPLIADPKEEGHE